MKTKTKTSLEQDFFIRETLVVAEAILGKILCRQLESGEILRDIITEVEAYDGSDDKASHANRGMTPRNEVMFGPAGYWYVYLCYGVHWMLNVVTGPDDYPAALLIRGLKTITGPGRLTRHMKIDKEFDGLKCHARSRLWIEDSGKKVEQAQIERTPRIGIDYAGDEWIGKLYRFLLRDLQE